MKSAKLIVMAAAAIIAAQSCCATKDVSEKVVVAYVTSWSQVMPDPHYVTHINYAFGHVNDSFDGVRIDNPDRLRAISALKKDHPGLKVMISIGGWGSGRFSEMAADPKLRDSFCADCKRVMKEFDLDGIDIDWEYPGNGGGAGISESPDDMANYTLLMKGIREAIGPKAWLTLASACTPRYIDFPSIMEYMDLINLMSYDMGFGAQFHNALYSSQYTGEWTTDNSVKAHIEAGVPKEKLVVGIPFYGRGTRDYRGGHDFRGIYPISDEYIQCWDEDAMVPYLTDQEGNFIFGYEDARSAAIKCDYINENGLRGGMYWDYNGNDDACTLSNVLSVKILGRESK